MPSWTDLNLTTSSLVRRLHAWWMTARGDRALPDRKDFDPTRFVDLMPSMLISEAVGDPFRIRYRIVGTRVAGIAGFDFTGRYLDELLNDNPGEPWLDFYAMAMETKLPVLGGVTEPTIAGGTFHYEFAICPVTAGGDAVRQFICVEDYFGFNLTSAGLKRWLDR